jgi:GTP 3',8-cyclase
MALVDALSRPLRSLRLSVTDRCNLRCQYCMPEESYAWLPREDLLTFEEIERVVDVCLGLGIDKVRLTGGEPLLRRDLPDLVRRLAARTGLTDLALTTNGVLLAQSVDALRDAGLHRLTVSLDTLHADRFTALTRLTSHARVLAGIEAAVAAFGSIKLDTVVMRGVNDDELEALLEYARARSSEVRFIEYMDVGGATHWSSDRVVSRAEILERIGERYGEVTPLSESVWAPADRFRLPDGTVFGIIASTTTPFCRTCDRARLTADGVWYMCLYAQQGVDLRGPLRGGVSPTDLASLIEGAWRTRTDRGAEHRVEASGRAALIPVSTLRANPHLEMHTRGG